MPYELNRILDEDIYVPTIAQMTQTAIDSLSVGDEGFMLMVEGGRIDHAGHDQSSKRSVYEVLAYDEALKVVYDFYEKHKSETLIICVSDHETGGLRLDGIEPLEPLSLMDEYDGDRDAFYDTIMSNYNIDDFTDKQSELIEDALDKVDFKVEAEDLYGRYDVLETVMINVLAQKAEVNWVTDWHSDTLVPTAFQGVNANLFNGFNDNTDIANILFDILGRD